MTFESSSGLVSFTVCSIARSKVVGGAIGGISGGDAIGGVSGDGVIVIVSGGGVIVIVSGGGVIVVGLHAQAASITTVANSPTANSRFTKR